MLTALPGAAENAGVLPGPADDPIGPKVFPGPVGFPADEVNGAAPGAPVVPGWLANTPNGGPPECCTIAGSFGSPPSSVGCGFGGWHTLISLISAPRNMMYS